MINDTAAVAPAAHDRALPRQAVRRLTALAAVATPVLFVALDPISQADSHAGRMWLALIAIGLLVLRFVRLPAQDDRRQSRPVRPRAAGPGLASVLAWRPHPRWTKRVRGLHATLLAGACAYGIGNYYQFELNKVTDLHSYQDTTYYYVNSKYFEELSYFSLYPAMLMADEEQPDGDRLLDEVKRYRDLSTYRTRSRKLSAREREQIRGEFSEKRWQAFSHDVRELVKRWPGGKTYFFSDHGYNPPPTWTVVGGTLASITPVEHVWVLAKIDLLLVILLLGLIARTYSAEVAAYSLLFFVTTYSGRWPMLGDSILRFDWCVALVAAACYLRREQALVAGSLLAYAALNRIFPAIFFFPVLMAFLVEYRRAGHVQRTHVRFVAGAAATTAVLVGAALWAYGIDAFVASKDNLLLHQSSASFSRYRVGFGTALGFRGEHTGHALAAAGGIAAKARLLDAWAGPIKALAAALLAFIAWWSVRGRWSSDRLLPLAIAPLFVLTNPQINYFNLRLLLIAWHFLALDRARNRFGLLALFGIEAMTQASHVVGNDRYATMAYTSIGLCVYFVAVYGGIAVEARWPRLGQRRANRLAGVGLAALALTDAAYWRVGTQIADRRIAATALAKVQETGARWNGPGTVQILPGQALVVAFDTPVRGRYVDISCDNNDRYDLRLFSGPDEIAQVSARRSSKTRMAGLWRTSIELPRAAHSHGVDRIEIRASGGDHVYAVGHVVLRP
ncbi:MAG: hypothetical protein B7733_20870 [Myxococcales bacterium FL481]|nr:MAG: hypothetical protein B7733_20870 [Myxococcales bacterium FL481]